VHGVVQPVGVHQVQQLRIDRLAVDAVEGPEGHAHREGQGHHKGGQYVVAQLSQGSQPQEVVGQRQGVVAELQQSAQEGHVLELAAHRWLQPQGHRQLGHLREPVVVVNGVAQVHGGGQVQQQARRVRVASLHFRMDTEAPADLSWHHGDRPNNQFDPGKKRWRWTW